MPTGYTAPIYEGRDISFAEFAWMCARAFGALIMQRDDSIGSPIVLREEPSQSDADSVAKAQAELARLATMTIETAAEEARADHATRLAEWTESSLRCAALQARYEAMLEEVKAWKPPGPEHEGLREYMAKQLRDSIDHDCMTWPPERPEPMEPAEWLALQQQAAERSLASAVQWAERSRHAAESRNAWIAALVESIGTPPQNDR